MFTNITRRTVTYVLVTVFVTLLFVLFSIFSLSKTLLNNDYNEKIIRFSKQEAINCSTKLELLKINIDNIIHDLNIDDALFVNKTNAEITMQLQKKNTYSPYIKNLYIFKGEKVKYYLRSKTNDSQITDVLKSNIFNQNTKSIWAPVYAQSNNNLYYMKDLENGYFVAVQVDENEIFDIFKNTSPFFEKENTFFFSDNRLCIFSNKNISQKIVDNAINGKYNTLTFEKDKIIYSLPIRKTSLKVCTVAKTDYINLTSTYLARIFLILLALTMLLCYYMINHFAKEITDGLEEIHNKILHYHR